VTLLSQRELRVAIAGNPNTGKTTLFNRLTGSSAKVGNYPGVTVERQFGTLELDHSGPVELLDVPGTYSLSARSREEQIAIQAVAGLSPVERPDAVLLVVDATQLTRNLYLVLQVIETDLPTVVALNMIDMLEGLGLEISASVLERELGVPVVPVSANAGRGLDALRNALDRVLEDPALGRPGPRWIPTDAPLLADLEAVEDAIPPEWSRGEARRARALALWALLSLDENDELADAPARLRETVLARRRGALADDRDLEAEIIQGRYSWIDARARNFLRTKERDRPSHTDRIDRVLLHPAIGFAAFLVVMGLVFQSLFSWADPAIRLIETLFDALRAGAVALLGDGIVSDFVANGLISGVGSVLVFLPQIMLLFLFIGLMEDTGYMARVAFLMDRLMKSIGLHGRAFVPMMSGFACAVPAILATRTMERKRDRFLSMMVVPLMTCSARLPVYTLIIAALFPPSRVFGFLPVQGLMMVAMYLFSTLVALVAAAVLGRTLFKGKRVPLLLEMPPYRKPHLPSVLPHDVAAQQDLRHRGRHGDPRLHGRDLGPAALPVERRAGAAVRGRARRGGGGADLAGGARRAPGGHRAPRGLAATARQLRRPPRSRDRACARAARLRLEDRHRHPGRVRRARGVRQHDGRRLRRRRRRRRAVEHAARAVARRVARGRSAGLHAARRRLADDLLRPRVPVHEHARGRAARDAQLALAGLPVRLHERARLRRELHGLPGRPVARPGLRETGEAWDSAARASA
jgi:ferrous iron transport protein B